MLRYLPARKLAGAFAAAAALVLHGLVVAAAPARADVDFNGQELTFLTWSDYIDTGVVAEFEKRFNARITFRYYESDQARTEILATANGHGIDLILVSGSDLNQYARRGWVAPLDDLDIPNRKNVDPRWFSEFEGGSVYGIPYFWGTVGIAYRRDLVPAPITSWSQLLNPPPELNGKILMNKDARELLAIANLALGHSVNSSDLGQLRQARRLLQAQAPSVKDYSYVSLTENSALVTGEAWATTIYNGDVLMLQEHNDRIAYAQPREGSILWVDYLTVTATSQKKRLAAAFINYLNEPKNAARLAEYVYYATPNAAAKEHLSQEYFSNPVIFPSNEQQARMTHLKPLAPRATKFANSLMARLLNMRQASR